MPLFTQICHWLGGNAISAARLDEVLFTLHNQIAVAGEYIADLFIGMPVGRQALAGIDETIADSCVLGVCHDLKDYSLSLRKIGDLGGISDNFAHIHHAP